MQKMNANIGMALPRHCEEQSDEAISDHPIPHYEIATLRSQ